MQSVYRAVCHLLLLRDVVIADLNSLFQDVTPENFLNIMLGKKAAMKGIGTGRVINR